MRTDLQPAYVLHTRNYTDSRILAELFSPAFGRVGAVARNAKKGGRFSVLRPFQPLLVSWQGRGELKTLTHSESSGPALTMVGDRLYCGIYLNELLLRVLAPVDSHPDLFNAYRDALAQLALHAEIEPVLRNFELDLLSELGYGLDFEAETDTGALIESQYRYLFTAGSGFTRAPGGAERGGAATGQLVLGGEAVLAVGRRDFSAPQSRAAAKHLCRLALQPLLGSRPLKSRELFG